MQFVPAFCNFIPNIATQCQVMTVHTRIKKLRTLKDISQKEMAERLHKSASAYNRMESGEIKIPLDELPEIARILDCTVDDLLQDEITINIQQYENNDQVFGYIQHQNNVTEELTVQFQSLLQQILSNQEKSEERMRIFMKELVQELKHH